MSTAWIYLIIAGILEWGWPVGLKLGKTSDGNTNWYWLGFAGVTMLASGALLMLAQREIPMGTAYAIWTGIGAVGAFILGILLFKESAEIKRFLFVGLIIVGIIGLKLSSH
ncbi:MAG TPA: multidrug efflux SMR transporter [Epsilonproteobacteria bacterium]|nr:multidrug efflux SMR transporter [Campylobacterota bacterium]